MAKIESLEEIKEITLHWSENNLINDTFDKGGDGDIEKIVDINELDSAVKESAKYIEGGYDKTKLTVKLKSGLLWADSCKFYITTRTTGLLNLLNEGE
jgi:hypothetical protein